MPLAPGQAAEQSRHRTGRRRDPSLAPMPCCTVSAASGQPPAHRLGASRHLWRGLPFSTGHTAGGVGGETLWRKHSRVWNRVVGRGLGAASAGECRAPQPCPSQFSADFFKVPRGWHLGQQGISSGHLARPWTPNTVQPGWSPSGRQGRQGAPGQHREVPPGLGCCIAPTSRCLAPSSRAALEGGGEGTAQPPSRGGTPTRQVHERLGLARALLKHLFTTCAFDF